MRYAAKPEAPDQNTFLKKWWFTSQNSAAGADRCGRRRVAYSSRKSASLDLANSWKNCSYSSSRMHTSLSSSSAFCRGFRSAATIFLGPSSSMSSTLQPPVVSMSMTSSGRMSSSSASMRGSSHATL